VVVVGWWVLLVVGWVCSPAGLRGVGGRGWGVRWSGWCRTSAFRDRCLCELIFGWGLLFFFLWSRLRVGLLCVWSGWLWGVAVGFG